MATYEYDRIRRIAAALEQCGVDSDTADQIMAGGESISKTASPEKKADWMGGAMSRMDALLDKPTRQAVREACACCLGGKRQEISKRIGKTHSNLQDAIAAANDAMFVFGHSVSLQNDGRVLVCFQPEDLEGYRCVCLPRAKGAISVTYCYCCGGHVKHHMQNVLKREVSCEVRSSALESGGKKPCSFLFTIEE